MSEPATATANVSELVRANKITAHFEANGVIVGTFYRTHEKLRSVRTTDVPDFKIPEGDDVTSNAKLEAFKQFLNDNAARWCITVDTEDRRAVKYPNRYDTATLESTADTVLQEKLVEIVKSTQSYIDKLVEGGLLPKGAVIAVKSAKPRATEITESYANGKLKYAVVKYSLEFAVGTNAKVLDVNVELVSGQLKKPTKIGTGAFTVMGLRSLLIEGGVLPKVVKEEKKDATEAATPQA
jgi:ribosomal protein S8E